MQFINSVKAIDYGTAQYGSINASLNLKNGLSSGNIGDIVSVFLPYLLTLAGLILFGMLIFGGFTMLSGAAEKDAAEKGKSMITNAVIGFIVIFAAYWIAQILQVIFKVNIVS